MANYRLLIWQRKLSIAMLAAFLGFIGGMILPIERSANHKNLKSIPLTTRQQNPEPDSAEVQVLKAQQNEAYRKVIVKVTAAEKARRLNSPIPTQFQGKTIRDVKLKDAPKPLVKGSSVQTKAIQAGKPIALTFDDGPWPNTTSQVLNVLKKHNVKATFFVVGKQVQKYPQVTKQITANGHAIGNHTWNHQYHQYSSAAASSEIDRTAELVLKVTGIKTTLFRPPAGILTNGLVGYAHQKKYAVIMWSADSRDWRYRHTAPQGVINTVLKDAKPGGIILLHDGGGDRSTTIQALPQIITQLKKRGYNFVTVPELLEIGDKQMKANKG